MKLVEALDAVMAVRGVAEARLRIIVEPVEPRFPERALLFHPFFRCLERLRLQPVDARAAFLARRDETAFLERGKVLHEGWQRHLVMSGEFPHGRRPPAKPADVAAHLLKPGVKTLGF